MSTTTKQANWTGGSQIEQRRVAVISTAHLTANDAALLNSGVEPSGLYYSNGYCWCFTEMDGDVAREWRECGFSDEMIDTVASVLATGFDRVEFDADGPKVEGLPVFDW
jgi:hypothetical protein